MDEPTVWLLRDKKSQIVWTTVERDYLSVVEDVLRHLDYKLIRESPGKCADCGFSVSSCMCRSLSGFSKQ